MRALDYLLLLLIALCAIFAYRTWRRAVQSGSCCGSCSGDCAHCGASCKKHDHSSHK